MSTPTTLQGIPLAGLRLGAPLGSGAGGVVWAATTAEGEKVAVRVLPDVEPARQVARSERLELIRSLTHPGLSGPLALGDEVDERLLVTRLVDGPTLATLRAGRMGLPAPEVLTLAAQLAEALAALHARGLTHGDVAPGNVLLDDDDGVAHVVLVDLVADLGREIGTAGFVAPEVRDGEIARPPSDVWALATVCVWAARVGEREEVARILHAALLDDAAARPSAASLAATLRRLPIEQLRVPPPSVLAGAALREQAQRSATVLRPSRRSRRARHRQRSSLGRLVAAAVVGAVLLVGGIGWLLQRPGDEAPAAVSAALTPAQVAALVEARDAALVGLDADALGEVTAPGSPARAEDEDLLGELVASRTSLDGLRTEISETQVLSTTTDAALVRTVLSQDAYRRTTAGVTEQVDAQQPRCVVLELTLHEHAWRVVSVSPCSS